jgi:hypothetical protein
MGTRRTRTVRLTERQYKIISEALNWIDAAGAYSEFMECLDAADQRAFDQGHTRFDTTPPDKERRCKSKK